MDAYSLLQNLQDKILEKVRENEATVALILATEAQIDRENSLRIPVSAVLLIESECVAKQYELQVLTEQLASARREQAKEARLSEESEARLQHAEDDLEKMAAEVQKELRSLESFVASILDEFNVTEELLLMSKEEERDQRRLLLSDEKAVNKSVREATLDASIATLRSQVQEREQYKAVVLHDLGNKQRELAVLKQKHHKQQQQQQQQQARRQTHVVSPTQQQQQQHGKKRGVDDRFKTASELLTSHSSNNYSTPASFATSSSSLPIDLYGAPVPLTVLQQQQQHTPLCNCIPPNPAVLSTGPDGRQYV
jgi:hypothetical protein